MELSVIVKSLVGSPFIRYIQSCKKMLKNTAAILRSSLAVRNAAEDTIWKC